MRELLLRTILLVPLYFLQPTSVSSNFQHIADQQCRNHSRLINTENPSASSSKNINTRKFRMDIYPADVFTSIGYIYLRTNTAGGYGRATAYLFRNKELNSKTTKNSIKNPERTTTMLFVIASLLTLIGSAQLASKLQFHQ